MTREPHRTIRSRSAVDAPTGYSVLLSNRLFLRLWLAQALSQTGQQTINFALLLQVHALIANRNLGGANTALGLLVLAFATPPILFSALAGVVVDRVDKRNVMALVNALRAVTIGGYLLLDPAWSAFVSLSYVYALALVFSTVGQLFGPAEGATLPVLVSTDRVLRANALFGLTYTGSQLAGFVLVGPLLTSLIGLDATYITVIAIYAVCTLLILSLPPVPAEARASGGDSQTTVMQDLREVWQYLGTDRLLRKAIGYLTLANTAFLTLVTLAPDFIYRGLGLAGARLALIITPAGLGMLIGALTIGRIGTSHAWRERIIDTALPGAGLALIGFSLAPTLLGPQTGPGVAPVSAIGLTMACASLLGFANALVIVPSQALLQERSTARNRARVLSSFFSLSSAAALLPIFLAGLLGDLLGSGTVLAGIGAIIVLAGLGARGTRVVHKGP